MASKDTLPTVKRERLESQDREKHTSSHTFSFCEDGKPANTISCTKGGTVLEALNTSLKFSTLVRNNKGKDIIIVRKTPENADIATHFPCWLIKEAEELTIQFSSWNKSVPDCPETATQQHEKLVTFYVERIGGKNCKSKNFLKNMSNTDISYLCIYARLGETVEKALQRDGRFEEIVFKEGSELMDKKGGSLMEINLTVTEQLDGKTFRLNMQKEKKNPSQSTTESSSGSRITKQAAGSAQEQGKFTTSSAKSAPANPPAQERGKSTSRSARSFHAMPDSEELLQILRSQFNGLVKQMMEREKVKGRGKLLELLVREEFGKNIKVCWDVCTVMNLMEMSKSICHIINNSLKVTGTGFLLFDHFILTNGHLIKDCNDSIEVTFHYDGQNLPVKKVIAKAYGWNEENEDKCWLDYALLELSVSTALPRPLLTQYGPPIKKGGVCIITHPDAGVKKVDFCSVIECKQRDSIIKQHEAAMQLWKFDADILENTITYDTCFFNGTSGSPVFDDRGQVVAMHTAGYIYKISVTESVIEYAIPLQTILKHFVRKMKGERRSDILQRFEKAKTQKDMCPLIADFDQPDPDSPEPMET